MHELTPTYLTHYPRFMEGPLEQSERFYELVKTRRTIRQFSDRPIPDGVLANAIRSAGSAPSGANVQPWFFAVIKSQEMKDKIRFAAEAVEQEFYQNQAGTEWAKDLSSLGTTAQKPYLSVAPAIIAVFTRQRPFDRDPREMKRSYYASESTGIAVGILLTALHHAGLATLTHTPRPMSFLNNLLELDNSYRPFLMVVTGHAADPCVVPKLERKELCEISRDY